MTNADRIRQLEAEIERLQEFTRKLAERLFLAAEVLARNAEKRRTPANCRDQDR